MARRAIRPRSTDGPLVDVVPLDLASQVSPPSASAGRQAFVVTPDEKARDVVQITLLDRPDPGYGVSVQLPDPLQTLLEHAVTVSAPASAIPGVRGRAMLESPRSRANSPSLVTRLAVAESLVTK
jgi:hypothetical protein